MATGKVVGSIFLATDELLRVEKLAVCSGPHFIDDSGLEIDKDGTRDVLSGTSFTEESVESIVSPADSLITRHLAIRLGKRNAKFKQNENLHIAYSKCKKPYDLEHKRVVNASDQQDLAGSKNSVKIEPRFESDRTDRIQCVIDLISYSLKINIYRRNEYQKLTNFAENTINNQNEMKL